MTAIIQVALLKPWAGHDAGALVSVDEVRAAAMIARKEAEIPGAAPKSRRPAKSAPEAVGE